MHNWKQAALYKTHRLCTVHDGLADYTKNPGRSALVSALKSLRTVDAPPGSRSISLDVSQSNNLVYSFRILTHDQSRGKSRRYGLPLKCTLDFDLLRWDVHFQAPLQAVEDFNRREKLRRNSRLRKIPKQPICISDGLFRLCRLDGAPGEMWSRVRV